MNEPQVWVLVIDDETDMREMLAFELSREGFEVTTAESGLAAVKALEKHKFDLAVTDLKMPGMDGVQTIEALKKIDPNIQVIVATGYGTVETAVACMKRGAYDYIHKPYNLTELKGLLEKAREKREGKNAEREDTRKWAFVGRMAAGGAHTMNNAVGIILGYAQSLLKRFPEGNPSRAPVAAIERQAQRFASIVKSIVDFYKRKETPPGLFPLETALQNVTERVKPRISEKKLILTARFNSKGAEVKGNSADLESALEKIIQNAIDASPDGGSIELTSEIQSTGGVVIAVRDSGNGIDKNSVDRVFDPFYTSNTKGEKLGLGLTLARYFVESHGGEISVQSASGKGTEVQVRIPATLPAAKVA